MTTADRLAEFAAIMNETNDSTSPEAMEYLRLHSDDEEFVRLAKTSQEVWRLLNPPRKKWWLF